MSMKYFVSTILFFCFTLAAALRAEPMIIPAAPTINASSYLVMDYASGHLLVEENIDKRLPPASLTKMMTTYVVAHELTKGNLDLNDEVLVSEKAWRMQGSRMFIEVGNRVSVNDLLHGVIIQSGNDASVALAEHISGTEEVFADLMTQHAKRLGMNNTSFMNSTGLPDGNHYTTARDLALLARALIRDFPEIYSWHSIKEFVYNDIKQHNRNKLLWRDASVDGIKTGHTEEAGYCLVTSAERDGMRLISVVMGSEGANARAKASQALLNYSYRFYETHKLYSAGEKVTSVPVWKADVETVNLGTGEDVHITVPRGQYDKLEPVVEVNSNIIAPVETGQQKGMLNIKLENEIVASVPLMTLEKIPQGGLVNRIKDEIRLMLQ